jgi:hypothetical protein
MMQVEQDSSTLQFENGVFGEGAVVSRLGSSVGINDLIVNE